TLFDSGSYDTGTPSTATVTIADNDPPDTAIDSSPVGTTTSTSAHFAFSGSNPVSAIAGFECRLDGGSFAACSSPVDYNHLGDGSHTFSVRAVASSGPADPSPATFTWIVDTTPPVIAVAADTPVLWPANGKLVPDTITGTISDAAAGVDP